MLSWKGFLVLGIAGALGTLLRYGTSIWLNSDDSFLPWGTLAVNVAGCFAIGFGFALLTGTSRLSQDWATVIHVGLLGGLTTFSSFGYEMVLLAEKRNPSIAGMYAVLTLGCAILAVVSGGRLARLWETL